MDYAAAERTEAIGRVLTATLRYVEASIFCRVLIRLGQSKTMKASTYPTVRIKTDVGFNGLEQEGFPAFPNRNMNITMTITMARRE